MRITDIGIRKYLSDYRFSERPDENGRVRREAVYVGDYYTLADPDRGGRCRKLVPWLCVGGWAGFLAALLPLSAGAATVYALRPLAFSALPLGIASAALPALLRSKAPMVRADAERISSALPGALLWAAILSGAALVGEGILALTGPERLLPGDGVFALGAALECVLAAAGRTRRSALATEKRYAR